MAVTLYLLLAVCSTLAAKLPQNLLGQCTTAQIGTLDGRPIQLTTLLMPPGIPDWTVTIPDVPGCLIVNGELATVCDFDLPPRAVFVSFALLNVHRTGTFSQTGSVTVTKYCGDM